MFYKCFINVLYKKNQKQLKVKYTEVITLILFNTERKIKFSFYLRLFLLILPYRKHVNKIIRSFMYHLKRAGNKCEVSFAM